MSYPELPSGYPVMDDADYGNMQGPNGEPSANNSDSSTPTSSRQSRSLQAERKDKGLRQARTDKAELEKERDDRHRSNSGDW